MALPPHHWPAPTDPRDAAARLIVFTRHDFPVDMVAAATTDIRRHGRVYTFDVLALLANPIALYYQTIESQPPAAFDFAPGSAEYFAYGYVGATVNELPNLRGEYVREFWESCESEVGRAMELLANKASQCLNLLEEISEFDAAISML